MERTPGETKGHVNQNMYIPKQQQVKKKWRSPLKRAKDEEASGLTTQHFALKHQQLNLKTKDTKTGQLVISNSN